MLMVWFAFVFLFLAEKIDVMRKNDGVLCAFAVVLTGSCGLVCFCGLWDSLHVTDYVQTKKHQGWGALLCIDRRFVRTIRNVRIKPFVAT